MKTTVLQCSVMKYFVGPIAPLKSALSTDFSVQARKIIVGITHFVIRNLLSCSVISRPSSTLVLRNIVHIMSTSKKIIYVESGRNQDDDLLQPHPGNSPKKFENFCMAGIG